ncbi:NTP transferase domain-containing protein, partial [Candidatus Poribacteria bacterium]|nr:NTP transferase domain-containing protein [Candidatus Poribacteria bacterium]
MNAPAARDDLRGRLERLLRLEFARDLPTFADDVVAAIEARIGSDADDATLRRLLCPLWVVLAGGRGTRIDPTGRLNKNLDIWFGAANTLQLSIRHLVGDMAPVVVVNPDTATRILRSNAPRGTGNRPGVVAPELVDADACATYLAADCAVAVQPVANGTGGALRAARDALAGSDAELIGVAFGDEPFIDRRLPAGTWASHVVAGADATLCGKRPDAVIDKGGLFFDDAGRLACTKEWYDMTDEEQASMHAALADGAAITNTGFSIFQREAVLERLDRMWLHKGETEYHHVDLFRLFHDDGLRTQAHIYEGEIRSGVNRWTNVLDGEEYLYARVRERLAQAGCRPHPNAQITLDEDIEELVGRDGIGVGCVLAGRVHLGTGVSVGPYCVLDNATVTGDTRVGARARLADTRLHNVAIADADCSPPVAEPIRELATVTELSSSELRNTLVSEGVRASNVRADGTVLPANWTTDGATLGIRRDPSLGMPYGDAPPLWEFVPEEYLPGAYTFGDMRGLPDWEALRAHVSRMMREEIAPRATSSEHVRKLLLANVDALLAAQFEGRHLTGRMTPEELWGVLYELAG